MTAPVTASEMVDDFEKGRRGESANVSDQREYDRGRAFQRALDAPPMLAPPANGPVITGESPILQGIVSVPFLMAGTLLYPVAAVATGISALLCVRLMPLVGPGGGWMQYFAFVPMLVVFWFSMRWDRRLGERHAQYRQMRHASRVIVFAIAGAALAALAWDSGGRGLVTLPHVAGAIIGAAAGQLLLTRGDGWRAFWYRTLDRFRLRDRQG